MNIRAKLISYTSSTETPAAERVVGQHYQNLFNAKNDTDEDKTLEWS